MESELSIFLEIEGDLLSGQANVSELTGKGNWFVNLFDTVQKHFWYSTNEVGQQDQLVNDIIDSGVK